MSRDYYSPYDEMYGTDTCWYDTDYLMKKNIRQPTGIMKMTDWRNYKYRICHKCGTEWNVSVQENSGKHYICPICAYKERQLHKY